MPAFPSLTPSTRVLTPGSRPSTVGTSLNGRCRMVGHSNAQADGQLRLTFVALSESEKNRIEAHYYGQAGGSSFGVDDEAGNWIYKDPPQIVDYSGPPPFYDVTITLESD